MINILFCFLYIKDGVYGLMGIIFVYKKFNYKDNIDLVEFKILKEEEIEEVLKSVFGIYLEIKFVFKCGNVFFII